MFRSFRASGKVWIHVRSATLWRRPRRGVEVKAFAWSVVVGANEEVADAADSIFDAAFLPGGMKVAKEGFDGELVQDAMARELGAVYSRQRMSTSPPRTGQRYLVTQTR